jgi:tellurite resistance protein
MPEADSSLLGRVANKLSEAPSYAEAGVKASILTVAAPEAAALFEAVVEGAFLVAHADGEFDTAERAAFQHVVLSACRGKVLERQVVALLADLEDQLQEDGMDKRCKMVARAIHRPEQAKEVLRISALIAYVSGGVSADEKRVLAKLTEEFGLKASALDTALAEAAQVLEPSE